MKQRQLTNEELCFLCRELGNLFSAGIGAGDSFALLAEDETDKRRRGLLEQLSRQADEGAPLHQIFRESGVFPHDVCALVEVGERVGRTEETLRSLGNYYDARVRLLRQLKSSLLYPAVLLAVMLVVVLVLLIWVLPVFNDVYGRLGSRLTGIAGGLLAFGAALRRCLPLLCILLAVVVIAAIVIAASPTLREKLLTLYRRTQGDRGITRRLNTARFIQALAMGIHCGMTDAEAAALAARLSEGAPAFSARCQQCIALLDEGRGLSEALRESGLLSTSESRLLETGIRSGRSGETMDQLALRLSEESEEALASAAGRVEPALVALMSILVGLILLSVMLPLLQIMTAIG